MPLFVVVRKLGWKDSYAALVIPLLFGASGIFWRRILVTSAMAFIPVVCLFIMPEWYNVRGTVMSGIMG